MTDTTMTSASWQNFEITVADLDRFANWLDENHVGLLLKDFTRRIIRGRLRFGKDSTLPALPIQVQPKGVLSWNQENQWKIGSQVLVARKRTSTTGTFVPDIGIIVDMSDQIIRIRFSDKEVEYKRYSPGSQEAQSLYEKIKKHIEDEQRKLQEASPDQVDEESQIDVIFLEHGDKISSRIEYALEHDPRFIKFNNCWYLKSWRTSISPKLLEQIQRRLWRENNREVTIQQVRNHLPDLPEGEPGDLSLFCALIDHPTWFAAKGENWRVLAPPPPPPDKAEALYYVYDPSTYQIILKPGDRLTTKKLIQTLKELGYYDSVVTWAEE